MTGGYFVALGLDQLGALPLQPGDPSQVGSFRIFARLAVGGMGRVYLARDPATSGLAAVKVLRSEYAEDADFRTRFEREVATVRLAQGAHIVTLLGSGFDDDLLWIATGYLPGISVTDAVAQFGPLDAPSAWRLVGDLAAAVGTVSEAGVVHRDVKPSNVVLTGDGAYLIDFGISQAADMSGITKTGVAVGTPAFMSPEQVSGKKTGTPSDVFSLASVVAYAVTQHAPFGDGATVDVLHRIAYEPPNSEVLERIAELDPELAELIGRCLQKDEADRPSPAELVEAVSSHGGSAEWPGPIRDLIRVRETRCAAVSVPDGPAAVEAPEPEGTPSREGAPSTAAKPSAETAEADSTPTALVEQAAQTPTPDSTPTMAVRPSLTQPDHPDTPGGSTREATATDHPATTRNRKRAALVGALSATTLAAVAAAAVVAYGAGGGRPAEKPTTQTTSRVANVDTGTPTSAGTTTEDTAGDSSSPVPTKHTSATVTTSSASTPSLPSPSSNLSDTPSTPSGSPTSSDSPTPPVSPDSSATSTSPTSPASPTTSSISETPTSPTTTPTSAGPSSDASPSRETTSSG